eukprot:gene29905-37036_t
MPSEYRSSEREMHPSAQHLWRHRRDQALFRRQIHQCSQIFNALIQNNYPPYFSAESDLVKYRLVHFLCTYIQSDRLTERKLSASTANCKGKIAFTLDKICKELDINTEKLSSVSDVLDTITASITTLFANPEYVAVLKSPPRILAHIAALNQQQEELINSVTGAFYE